MRLQCFSTCKHVIAHTDSPYKVWNLMHETETQSFSSHHFEIVFFFNLNTCAVSLWWIGVTRSRLKLLTRFFWRCAVPFMNFKLRTLWTAFCLCRFSLAVSLTNKRAHSPYVIQSTVLECWNAAVSWCKSTALCASLHSYDATRELISRMQIRNIVCEWKLL